MKEVIFLIFIVIFLSSCTNNRQSEQSSAANDSVVTDQNSPTPSDTMCFRRLAGTKNQDTTYVKLLIGNAVTGTMDYLPFEKDSRKGSLQGNMSGNIVKAVWTYMQEGITDSLTVAFTVNSNKLMQQEYSIDASTGREVLKDNAPYTIEYSAIDCSAYQENQ